MLSPRSHLRLAVAVVSLSLALGACGDDDDDDDVGLDAIETTTTTADATTSTTTTASTTTTTEAPAGGTGTIVTQDDDPWRATAVQFRAEPIGTEHEFECPGGGEPDTVWGSDIYTDDSSVCTAAVHAGAITVEAGGTVTIRLEGEQDSFEASERHGIASLEYPAWPGSFSVVGAT